MNLNQDSIPPEFETAINTLYGYKDAIVNSLETGYTNAVVEGNNHLIKSIKKYSENLKMFDFIKKISYNKRNSHQLVIQYIRCKFRG